MISEKKQIIATLNKLPDNTTWEDAMYTLYFHYKLAKSKENIKNGRVMTIEELKEYIDELEEKNANNNIKQRQK